jgi:hypothetical protein
VLPACDFFSHHRQELLKSIATNGVDYDLNIERTIRMAQAVSDASDLLPRNLIMSKAISGSI